MVLTAFRGLDGVASFGADSAGLTSGNVATPLADGALIVDRAPGTWEGSTRHLVARSGGGGGRCVAASGRCRGSGVA